MLPPFYQQISGTGTFVLCDTTVTYSTTDIRAVAMACKVLNDNSLTPATNAQLTNLLQTVEFFENIGTVKNETNFFSNLIQIICCIFQVVQF